MQLSLLWRKHFLPGSITVPAPATACLPFFSCIKRSCLTPLPSACAYYSVPPFPAVSNIFHTLCSGVSHLPKFASLVVDSSRTIGTCYICLPNDFSNTNIINIPRNSQRESLSKDGLSGRIRLTSDMTEDEIFSEIRSVFRVPMANNDQFTFDVLQSTGGQNKTIQFVQVDCECSCTKEC